MGISHISIHFKEVCPFLGCTKTSTLRSLSTATFPRFPSLSVLNEQIHAAKRQPKSCSTMKTVFDHNEWQIRVAFWYLVLHPETTAPNRNSILDVCKYQTIWVPFRLTSVWRVTVSPIVPIKINTYVLMNDNPIPEDRKNLTPLNVMGLIQGKVFPRSACRSWITWDWPWDVPYWKQVV